MRRENSIALKALIGACAGLLLAACETTPPDMAQGPGPAYPPPQAAPPSSQSATLTPPLEPEAQSYPRYGDSDDYLCNNGTPGDPRTVEACARLRGTAALPITQPTGRYGDSDDYLCNFAAPGDPRTPQACARLRGEDSPPTPRQQSRWGDSDDFVCNHGAPGDNRTIQACLRLRGPAQ